ncbi:TPA: hypothetical protein GXZ54_06920 [bacterium]|nr:hypothetical protein [bacterium]
MFKTKNHIGIDFSTVNTRIYIHNKGIIYDEPTTMCHKKDTNKIITGFEAKDYASNNDDVLLVNPLLEAPNQDLIKYCVSIIKKLKVKVFSLNIYVLSFSIELNEEEQQKLVKACKLRKKDQIYFIDPLILSAIGNDIDITSNSKKLIVNIGASTSSAAIIAENQISIHETLPVDGKFLDFSIVKYLKLKHNLDISFDEANEIKIKLVDLSGKVNKKILIQGIEIDSNELRPIIGENIDRLCQSLKLLLDVLSTSTLESIRETGMFLIGGTSSINGIDKYIKEKLNIKVNVGPNPLNGLIEGMIKTFKNL